MSTHNYKNSIKKLVSLMGVASASVLLSFPALSLNNSNPSSSNESPNNRTSRVDSIGRSRQLLAQNNSGTGQTGTGQNGTGGTGTGGMGTGQNGTGGMGTGGTGTGGTGTGGTGTGGAATGQTCTAGTTSGNRRSASRQQAFTQCMNAGYAATAQRDYPTALAYFQQALQLRPGNPYATRAISNVQSYMQRSTSSTPSNSGGTTTTPSNSGSF